MLLCLDGLNLMLHFWGDITYNMLGMLRFLVKYPIIGSQVFAAQHLSHPAVACPAVAPGISNFPTQLLLWLLRPSLYLVTEVSCQMSQVAKTSCLRSMYQLHVSLCDCLYLTAGSGM